MAVGIIYALEPIEVEHENGELLSAGDVTKAFVKLYLKQAAIG
jgi:hypothetical protein